MDWSTLTDEDLQTEVAAGQDEIARRAREHHVISELEQVQHDALATKGWSDGDPWVEPGGVHDAFPVGARAEADGRIWVNHLPSNPFPPGLTGWVEETPMGEHPVWWQPLGAHDRRTWGVGAKAWHDGILWESTRDENVWPPGTGPDYWVKVEGDPGEPEEPAEWVRPTGAHDAYPQGAHVIFQGGIYRSRINANVYSPTEYPQGWERLGDA